MASFRLLDQDPSQGGYLSVSELTDQVKGLLESAFNGIAVRGQVSNLSRASSGHVYFSLKDDRASLRAVIWKAQAARVRFELENGLAVLARGDLTVYPPRGEYQLLVRAIEPEGIGALELAFRQMCDRLRAEGLFDPARKRPLPHFPQRLLVISSPTGAAVRDFLQVVGRRWPAAEVLVLPARVQGEGAAADLVRAIALANSLAHADAIILARGGGSLEDLWPFNEEAVARAIYHSRLPVVSAIGHENDVTIADMVADLRALTPTDAATRCVPDAQAQRRHVDQLARRLAGSGQRHLASSRALLDRLADRLRFAQRHRLNDARVQLDRLAARVDQLMRSQLDGRSQRLARLIAQLEALSPLSVLARGYSLTQRLEDGSILRDASTVHTGELVRTRLSRGELLSRVEPTSPPEP